jgi:hypothetical protein
VPASDGRPGIYFLANDPVRSWVIAFLESLRVQHPDTPLVLIPYDTNIGALQRLRSRFEFDVLDADFRSLDKIGEAVGGPGPGVPMFRKLACFWGPLEQFVYLDSDHVLTAPIPDVLSGVAPSEIAFESQTSAEHVFRPGSPEDHPGPVFNAGGFAARCGALSFDQVDDCAAAVGDRRASFADTHDQPFFNVLVRRVGLRAAVFHDLAIGLRFIWAGDHIALARRGDRIVDEHGARIGAIHWAGIDLGAKMPQRTTWLEFRYRSGPARRLVRATVTDRLQRLPGSLRHRASRRGTAR